MTLSSFSPKTSIFILISTCVLSRIYCLLFLKSMWLDEAALALALDKASWIHLLRGELINIQSTSLIFAIFGKLFIEYCHSEILIHLLPTLSGCLTAYFLYRIGFRLAGNFLSVIILFCYSLSYPALYYSTEFKQYSTEMLVTTFLIYLFIKEQSIKEYYFSWKIIGIFIISLCCSTPSIFVISGFCLIRVVENFLKIFSKSEYTLELCFFFRKTIFPLCCFAIFALCYYHFYLKPTANRQMFSFWQSGFIPSNLLGALKWTYEKGIFDFSGTLLKTPNMAVLYLLVLSTVIGIFLMFQRFRQLTLILLSVVAFALLTSYLKIYPTGKGSFHSSFMNSRLSLYLSPIFILFMAFTLHRLLIKFKTLCYICLPIIAITLNIFFCSTPFMTENYTRELALRLKEQCGTDKCLVFSNKHIEASLEYYARLYSYSQNRIDAFARKNWLVNDYLGKLLGNSKHCSKKIFIHLNTKNLPPSHQNDALLTNWLNTISILAKQQNRDTHFDKSHTVIANSSVTGIVTVEVNKCQNY